MTKKHKKSLEEVVQSYIGVVYNPYFPTNIGPKNIEEAWQDFLLRKKLATVALTRYATKIQLESPFEIEIEKLNKNFQKLG